MVAETAERRVLGVVSTRESKRESPARNSEADWKKDRKVIVKELGNRIGELGNLELELGSETGKVDWEIGRETGKADGKIGREAGKAD